MSVLEKQSLDMSRLLMQAYEIGDMINLSKETADYLYWKNKMGNEQDVNLLVRQLAKKKELFDECQRFGHFHPDYHAALEAVKDIESKLEQLESVKLYKQAENQVDRLLQQISETIAFAVSDTIKVPGNDPLPSKGCSTGGGCSGSCG